MINLKVEYWIILALWVFSNLNQDGAAVEAFCDVNPEVGWIVIQRRSSGPRDEFNRTWADYANGFGCLDGNFWLGLENIHALTKNGDQEMRIELEDFEGGKRWAKYSSFSISNASDFYRLAISGFDEDSTLRDSMTNSSHVLNGMRFSTIDKDNDGWKNNCAELYSGGWWFNDCFAANLNGLYREKGETFQKWQGIHWNLWRGGEYSFAKTQMKIRPRSTQDNN